MLLLRWTLAAAGGLALLGAAAAASAAPAPERALEERLRASLENPEARLVVERIEAPATGCRPDWSRLSSAEAEPTLGLRQPVSASGRLALRVPGASDGRDCQAWIWARVRVYARVPVTVKPLSSGASLAGAWKLEERELRAGIVPWSPGSGSEAEAHRSLPAGQLIGADMVRRAGLAPGQPVKVLLVSGALAIEQSGTAVPCGRLKTCAVLPSGRHIEGSWEDGRLVVRAP